MIENLRVVEGGGGFQRDIIVSLCFDTVMHGMFLRLIQKGCSIQEIVNVHVAS